MSRSDPPPPGQPGADSSDSSGAPPPDADLIGPLLVERWPIKSDESVRVEVAPPTVESPEEVLRLTLSGPRHRYFLSLKLLHAPGGVDRWALLVDAMDAMFGQLIDSGRAHRELPTGRGVEFQGAELEVVVEHVVPELEKLADQLLAGEEP